MVTTDTYQTSVLGLPTHILCLPGLAQVSCATADPIQFDIKVRIVNCAAHKTTTAKPTALIPLAAAPAPGPVVVASQPAVPAPGPVAAAHVLNP